MKLGGNKKAKDFFNEQDSWNSSQNFQARYNSIAAALYRDKLLALAEGRDWNLESAKSKIEKQQSNHIPHSKSAGALASSIDNTSIGNSNDSSYQNSENFRELNEQKAKFFDRVQNENSMRRDDIPPSQGGRYQGMRNFIYMVDNLFY